MWAVTTAFDVSIWIMGRHGEHRDQHADETKMKILSGAADSTVRENPRLADHDVVVLDEPTANLDATTAAQVLDTVLDRCDDRTTVLLGHAG